MKTLLEILTELRPEFNFRLSQDFIGDGMLDSFDVVTLVSELELNCAISIEGTEIIPENFKNIVAITSLLEKYGVTV